MKLLEDYSVSLSADRWIKIKEQLTKVESNSLVSITWTGPFERTRILRFKSENDALIFVLRWS
jgi:hypothetical protein